MGRGSPLLETSLLQYLRSVGLTGCKLACNESSCGSCTVLLSSWRQAREGGEGRLEEVTVTACSLPLVSLQGSQVRTVEGLGGSTSTSTSTSRLHPVQERLKDNPFHKDLAWLGPAREAPGEAGLT